MAKPGPHNLRCGMVSIIGRPNVGKSTLLNSIIKQKISIVSKVQQTTRYLIRGIYNEERGQIIFIDTPGLHRGHDQMDKAMNASSRGSIEGVDCIIYLVDANRPVGDEEEMILGQLKEVKVPVILGLNKIDQNGICASEYITRWQDTWGEKLHDAKRFTLLPLSGMTENNIDKLIDILFEYLPCGPALYPPDMVCDLPQKLVVADIIREKLLGMMREEIPHSLAVVVEEITRRPKKVIYILAHILVERDSQKEIVIGKRGDVLKKVGTLARRELETLLDAKIFLELNVKCQQRWRDDISTLQDLGHSDY